MASTLGSDSKVIEKEDIALVDLSSSADENEDPRVGSAMELDEEDELAATQVVPSEKIEEGANNQKEKDKEDSRLEAAKTKLEFDKLLLEIKGQKLKKCTPKNIEQLGKKFKRAYKRIKDFSAPIHVKVQEKIRETKHLIVTTQTVWELLGELMSQITPEAAPLLLKESKEARDELKKLQVAKYTAKFLKGLDLLRTKIENLGSEEVDLEDETNSAYLVREEMKRQYMDSFYRLCELTGHCKSTNRPVEEGFRLVEFNAGTGSAGLDHEIESFLNSMDHLSIPDFADIFEIIEKTNKNNKLGLGCNYKLTEDVFERVSKEIKRRRGLDFRFHMLSHLPSIENNAMETDEGEMQDPADTDPELLAKLEANKALRSSEREVLQEYVRLQQEKNEQNEPDPELSDEEDDQEGNEGQLETNEDVAECNVLASSDDE